MANGHVEIHDPLANRKDQNGTADPNPPTEAVSDSLEFRMMRAYAQRRRRGNNNNNVQAGANRGMDLVGQTGGGIGDPSSPSSPATTHDTKPRKKKTWMRLTKVFKCIKPQTDEGPDDKEEPQDPNYRCLPASGGGQQQLHQEEGGELEAAAADRLMRIADEIPFTPPDVEPDAPADDENVEKLIGLLLRESGDRLNETQELRDALMASQMLWNYSFFERLIQTLLRRMGLLTPDPQAPGPQTSPKTQMAITCEVATRLSAADTLPMNRLLGYGAAYLQKHISPWAKQQGGYDAVFEEDDDDDDDEVQ